MRAPPSAGGASAGCPTSSKHTLTDSGLSSPSPRLASPVRSAYRKGMAQAWPDDPEQEGDFAVEERRRTKRPRRWKVLLHNDDFTSMEFVVEVLVTHFHKAPA